MKHILVDVYVRIDYLPYIVDCIIALNVRRKIPLSKTASDSAYFVKISIKPRKKRM